MPITPGTRLEHYDVLGPLGAGGMGEVYRARDTKLKREVALKILPAQFVRDPSRLARFEREAQVLASLNHPNIAAIYGLEHARGANLPEYPDGPRFLVLELVEGPTLADRLSSGRFAVPEALRIAAQIAEAMEAAHDKGVLHRDLKPANIKLTPSGGVKVLDFGLAKALGEPEIPSMTGGSETITMEETRAGVVMGTAAYMSPEQASGKPTDKRTDIWAFGAVLYEMLTGHKPFDGKSMAHIIVHVLEQTPDWSALPPLPSGIPELLEGCMQKDPAMRRRDIGDVRVQLQAAITQPVRIGQSGAVAMQAPRQRWLWPGVAAAILVVAAVGTYAYLNRPKPVADAIRFDIGIPDSGSSVGGAAISPNGRELAFIGLNKEGETLLWIRALNAPDSRPMIGTEGASGIPFWSPDGRYVAFESDGKLKKVESAGGPSQTLCTLPGATVLGGLWTTDGRIIFGLNAPTSEHQVAAAGGAARPLPSIGSGPALVASPALLPDGKHFVYYTQSPSGDGGTGIFVAPLDENSGEKPRQVLSDLSTAVYAAGTDSDRGYLLFVRGATGPTSVGTLMAQPFDPDRNEVAGEAVPVAENVTPGGFSASETGVLVFGSNSALGAGSQLGTLGVLAWVDRTGRELSTAGPIRPYFFNIALSPDGSRVASSHENDLWIWEFARGTDSRFTFEKENEFGPQWRRDGSRIVYTRGLDLYERPADGAGSPTMFFKSTDASPLLSGEWTPDGRYLSVSTGGGAGDGWLVPAEGTPETRKLIPLVGGPYNERGIRFSPDGKYFSYTSNETGRDEAFVRPFDASTATSPGGKWMVSTGGGVSPHWRNDGQEMYYMSLDGAMMAVPIDRKSGFRPGTPQKLFKLPGQVRFWDVAPDGKRFLLPMPPGMGASTPYHVIVNWWSAMKK